jgi:hypothetical protein
MSARGGFEMSDYEPYDSRDDALNRNLAPGQPPAGGPHECLARPARSELDGDERGEEAENAPTPHERAVGRGG